MVLIAYDILVEIDPTRCFFLNCNDATVNSTTNTTVTGWPINISWPAYFQTAMNAKRIFQGIQIASAGLFMLFASLYILTYFIYRKIHLQDNTIYSAQSRAHDTIVTPTKRSNNVLQSHPPYDSHRQVTTYMIAGQTTPLTKHRPSPAVPVGQQTIVTRKPQKKPAVRPRANSVNYDRICTRCMREPRMILATNFERQNYFSHLCASCNNDLITYRRKGVGIYPSSNRKWKP